MPKVKNATGSATRSTSGQMPAVSRPSRSAATGGCHQAGISNALSQASSATSAPVDTAQTSRTRATVRPVCSTRPPASVDVTAARTRRSAARR